jgi:hypothetical protein
MPTSENRRRTTQTLALAVVLITAFATFVPPDRDTTLDDQFLLKLHWRRCADIVMTGDSTVLWSLDPAVVERYVPRLRVVNFGYYEAGYVGGYLDAISRVIDPESPAPIIVVGLNPISLAINTNPQMQNGSGAWNNVVREKSAIKTTTVRTWREKLRLRFQIRTLCTFLLGACPHRYTNSRGAHGFIRAVRRPFDPTFKDQWYKRTPPPFSMSNLDDFFDRVRYWSGRGIKVVGLIMPTSPLIRWLMTASGYDEKAVHDAFVSAGGVLLDGSADAETFDGVHLTPTAAAELSAKVGEYLSRVVGPQPLRTGSKVCPWSEPSP